MSFSIWELVLRLKSLLSQQGHRWLNLSLRLQKISLSQGPIQMAVVSESLSWIFTYSLVATAPCNNMAQPLHKMVICICFK